MFDIEGKYLKTIIEASSCGSTTVSPNGITYKVEKTMSDYSDDNYSDVGDTDENDFMEQTKEAVDLGVSTAKNDIQNTNDNYIDEAFATAVGTYHTDGGSADGRISYYATKDEDGNTLLVTTLNTPCPVYVEANTNTRTLDVYSSWTTDENGVKHGTGSKETVPINGQVNVVTFKEEEDGSCDISFDLSGYDYNENTGTWEPATSVTDIDFNPYDDPFNPFDDYNPFDNGYFDFTENSSC